MKKSPLLNQALSRVIAGMGHNQMLVIADAGLPIPPGVERIDLAVTAGMPPFLDVLNAVLTELKVERAVIADEMTQVSPAVAAALTAALPDVPFDRVTHTTFKAMTENAVAIVRTGEFTPYANVILIAGVVF